MDIIVDTCILLQDPWMRLSDFENVFHYLRKTDSRLTILRIVFDEVTARFPERLSECHTRAREAARALNNVSMNPAIPPLPDLDLAAEIDRYRQVLSSNVRDGRRLPLHIMPDYSGIELKEVVERGIKRIPPADSKGEELRDVMLWLGSVSYCRISQAPTVFISSDKAFLEKGTTNLKKELREELTREGIVLSFYSSIKDFLKSIAKGMEASKEWLAQHLEISKAKEIFETQILYIVSPVWHGERGSTVLRSDIDIRNGRLYDLGQGAQVAEVEVAGQVLVNISDWPYPPPEATLPEGEAREVRRNQKPVRSEDYKIEASLFLSLRLQDDQVVEIVPERFEFNTPINAPIQPSPVSLKW